MIAVSSSTGGESCACELIAVNRPPTTVSHHMRQLIDAGLVTREARQMGARLRHAASGWPEQSPRFPKHIFRTAADRTLGTLA